MDTELENTGGLSCGYCKPNNSTTKSRSAEASSMVGRKVGDFSDYPATRLTAKSGASKGMRITRHDLLPPAALREVSAVYGLGELKYPAGPAGPNWLNGSEDNDLQGMPFSWNERAAEDHVSFWKEGIDFDPEDGIHHLAHAIWHLLAILEYEARGIGEDDRPYKR